MKRQLFSCIADFDAKYDPWFVQKYDVLGRLEFTSRKTCSK